MDWYFGHGKNARATCRHLGISPDTFYTWLRRYDLLNPTSLEDRPRRPKQFRQSKAPWQIVDLVDLLRKHFPTWSEKKWEPLFKNIPKLKALIEFIENESDKRRAKELLNSLEPQALAVSHSTIGRIISKKKFFFAKSKPKPSKKSSIERKRADKSLKEQAPGSLIQIDAKHLTTPYGKKYYQFTAIDCKTRIKFARCFTTASSYSAKLFLIEAIKFFPFAINNVQTDNGSEFLKYFHRALKEIQDEEIIHYFSHPHCPKENSRVERVIRTDYYEFYLNGNTSPELKRQNEKLTKWNYIYNHPYNHLRPHESLGNLSPMEYYEKIKDKYQKQPKNKVENIPFIVINEAPKVYGML